jgi:hypothetical protein
MVKICCYGLCKCNSKKEPTIEFLPFPKPKTNLERAKRWVHLCGRPTFFFSIEKITSRTYICVKHFGRGENLDLHANLSLEPFPAHSEEDCRRHHEKALLCRPLIENLEDSEKTASVLPLKVLKVSLNKSYSKKVSKVRFLPLNPPRSEKNDQIDKIEGNVQSSTECRLTFIYVFLPSRIRNRRRPNVVPIFDCFSFVFVSNHPISKKTNKTPIKYGDC